MILVLLHQDEWNKISKIFSLDGDLVMMNPMEENTPQTNASCNCVWNFVCPYLTGVKFW